jgi:predicted TIM-barrel fold metal-dependent hydrolase
MAENHWTSAQVAKYPHRLIGFCSVNPLRPYAVDAGAPLSHYAKTLMWVRDILPAIHEFKIFDHGQLLDTWRTHWIQTHGARFATYNGLAKRAAPGPVVWIQ